MHKNQSNMDNTILLKRFRQGFAIPRSPKNQKIHFQAKTTPFGIQFPLQRQFRQVHNVNTVKESLHFQNAQKQSNDQKNQYLRHYKGQETSQLWNQQAANKIQSLKARNILQKVIVQHNHNKMFVNQRNLTENHHKDVLSVSKNIVCKNLVQREGISSNNAKYMLTVNYCNPNYYHSMEDPLNLQSFYVENKHEKIKRMKSIKKIFSNLPQEQQRCAGNINKVYSPQFQSNRKINFTQIDRQSPKKIKRSYLKEQTSTVFNDKERISQPNLNKYWLKVRQEEQLGNKTKADQKSQQNSKCSSFKQFKPAQLDEVNKIMEDPFQFLSPKSKKTILSQAKSLGQKGKEKQSSRKISQKVKSILVGKPRQKKIGSPKLNKLYLNAKEIEMNLIQKTRKVSYQEQGKNRNSCQKKMFSTVRSSQNIFSVKNSQNRVTSKGFLNAKNSQKHDKDLYPKDSSARPKRSNITERNSINKVRSSPNFLSQFYIKASASAKSKQNEGSSILSNKKQQTHISTHFQGENTNNSGKSMSIAKHSQMIQRLFLYPIKNSGAQAQQKAQQFVILKKLAVNVSVGIHVKSSTIYCLKQLKLQKKNADNVINQYKFLSYLQHTNICKVYGAFTENSEKLPFSQIVPNEEDLIGVRKIYLLMEYLQNLTLKQQNQKFLSKFSNKNSNAHYVSTQESLKYQDLKKCKRIYYFIEQIAHALKLIHKNNVIHRDLKPLNIFISNKIYKIGDFGSSTFTGSQEHIGTLDYAAPQILLQGQYDKSIDIWSLGCIIYEMYTGVPPFYHDERQTTFKNTINMKYDDSLVKNQSLRRLIGSMLKLDPTSRIKIQQILKHPFCQEYKKLLTNHSQA